MTAPRPPVAEVRPLLLETHGVSRSDPYAWLRDREDPATRAYLEAENAYTDAVTAGHKDLEDTLYAEMIGRINEDDQTVPVRDGPFLYYARSVKGQDYWLHARRPLAQGAPESEAGPEEVYFDENTWAKGHAFFSLGDFDIDAAHRIAAFTIDTEGDERHTLHFRDLSTAEALPDLIEDVGDDVVWARDGKTLFYVRLDDANRPFQVWRHVLGTAADADVMVFEELDEAFFVGVRLTRTERFVVIGVHSQVTSEEHLIEAEHPDGPLRCVAPREQNVEYGVEHHRHAGGESLLILTNKGAPTFQVVSAPLDDLGQWTVWQADEADVTIEDVEAFAHHVVVAQRRDALVELVVHPVAPGESPYVVPMPDPVYAAWVGANPDVDTQVLRFSYASMGVPGSVFDLDLRTQTRTLRKQTEVADFDPAEVVTERMWVEAKDGERIPVSVVRRKEDVGRAVPIWLTAYGAYGSTNDPSFSTVRVSLLRRGVGVAVAHVRGGADKGRAWYEDGKLGKKKNTFSDFVAVAVALRERGVASKLGIYGGSAGGLLIGAAVNARPGLFDVAVADVPFVDVLNTMLDATLPLTVVEWEEWGNPAEREAFDDIRAYAPYENVVAQPYPAMMILAGWSDPRVGYWEPAKLTARLRATKTDNNPLVLRTHLEAGHGGPSGRYAAYRETAFLYAFALSVLNPAT